jgi:hypothetical protein
MAWPGAAQQPGGGLGAELLADRIGEEVPQQEQNVQALQRAGALGHQLLPSFGEQPQDLGVALWAVLGLDGGQPIVS